MIDYLSMIDTPEDRSKFEKIYEEYKGLMYHVAYQILNNQQDAEDAVHQAFVKIAEIIEEIDDSVPQKLKGFVVTITEHNAIDMYRKKQRHTTVELNDALGLTIEYNGTSVLTACMTKLPANYRHILQLKHFHGYSSKEISKIMGISESNVIKIDQRAKKKLLSLCEEEGIY